LVEDATEESTLFQTNMAFDPSLCTGAYALHVERTPFIPMSLTAGAMKGVTSTKKTLETPAPSCKGLQLVILLMMARTTASFFEILAIPTFISPIMMPPTSAPLSKITCGYRQKALAPSELSIW